MHAEQSNEEDERQRKFMELQNENLTRALSLVEWMTNLSEAQTKGAQQLLASASKINDGQPAPAQSLVQRALHTGIEKEKGDSYYQQTTS